MVGLLSVGREVTKPLRIGNLEAFADYCGKQAFPPDTVNFFRVIKEGKDGRVTVIDRLRVAQDIVFFRMQAYIPVSIVAVAIVVATILYALSQNTPAESGNREQTLYSSSGSNDTMPAQMMSPS